MNDTTIVCLECQKVFTGHNRFCSADCAEVWYHERLEKLETLLNKILDEEVYESEVVEHKGE